MEKDIRFRWAQSVDIEKVVALADKVFEPADGKRLDMASALPLFFSSANANNIALAVADGDIVSVIVLWPFWVRAGSIRYSAAHVGAVATDPNWRNQGLASKLLQMIYDRLAHLDVDVAFISGDRDLYRRSGAIPDQTLRWAEIPLGGSGSPSVPLNPLTTRNYDEAAMLWERERVTIVRNPWMWELGLSAVPDAPGHHRICAYSGNLRQAYVVMDYDASGSHGQIKEVAGSRDLAIAGATRLAEDVGLSSLRIPIPAWDAELRARFPAAHQTKGTSTYRLVNPAKTFNRVVEQLGGPCGGCAMRSEEGSFVLTTSAGTSTGDVAWATDLMLNSPGKELAPWFPLPLPIWSGITYG